jgi:hypothetical protein
MPRFANGETGRKSQSDTIQKMKRQLATAISRHATLQHENQQLHQEYQLLQAVCSALGMVMHKLAAALLLQCLQVIEGGQPARLYMPGTPPSNSTP